MKVMRLKILLPSEVFLDRRVEKIIAEAENGSFCLLPKHIDFVTSLVPGIFSFVTTDDEEVFMAVDQGILVKCGSEVSVSTRKAVIGPDLRRLKETIEREFRTLDEKEKKARSAAFKLESDLIRRYLELKEHG